MRSLSGRYRLAPWDSVQAGERSVPPGAAAGWLIAWLTDPDLRAEVAAVCEELGLPPRFTTHGMDQRKLQTYVRPAIERSLSSGQLVLLERVKPRKLPTLEPPREAPPPPSLQKDEPKSTRTWIELLVTDMSDQPVKDVNYEVTLPDGSKKSGKTDGHGLARFDGIDPGLCEFRLVDYDGDAVESLDEAGQRKKSAASAAAAPPPPPAALTDAAGEIADEIFVVAAELRDIGAALLPDHPVRIVDAETGEAVTGDLKTDEKGVVRAEVPENKAYRIEIGEAEITPAPAQTFSPDPPHAILFVEFVDEGGKPLAHETVHVVADGAKHEIETDDQGRIHADAPFAPCELEVRDQRFVAHALPAADAQHESNVYRFVVAEGSK